MPALTFLRVKFTSNNVIFQLSDNSTHYRLYTAMPFTFLYETQATQAQREDYDIIANGKIVEWAELGQMVTVEQVVG
ncbi:hypothetical protein MUN82_03815 [Hymenobacter aerilatus]|uniref:DUF2442 domain-containing protein n=1 Tax=Hymenobacter aerilatus TaxID=2932251 RepID=A0A8T9SWL0_9BACT|nr:hypothetical protein [Hymenobacter aerilatus]UOR06225.1 hypothetical protein MUN82_03815 [Hymenobacter aerilatus]